MRASCIGFVACGLLLAAAGCGSGWNGVITTAAGTGTLGNAGDGGPAIRAEMGQPTCAVPDGSGHLFISDIQFEVIRKIDLSTGTISTYAGTGAEGYGGDGGPATQAILDGPTGCSVDANGNLVFADIGSNRVRRIDANTGIITTIAGSGYGYGPYHEGGFAGDGGPAIAAELNKPRGTALDTAGNLFIADDGNNRVRRVDAKTGIITTLAGNGTYAHTGDGGPALQASSAGALRVAVNAAATKVYWTEGLGYVRELTLATGGLRTVAGDGVSDGYQGLSGNGGPATAARLYYPEGLAFDSAGRLLVSDSGDNVVRIVDLTTGTINALAGNGAPGLTGDGGNAQKAELHNPEGLAFDADGSLYIADAYNGVIRKVTGLQ